METKGQDDIDATSTPDERVQELRKSLTHLWELKQMDEAFAHTDNMHRNEIVRGQLWIGDVTTDGSTFGAIVSIGCRDGMYNTHENVHYFRIVAQDSSSENLRQYFDEASTFIHFHRERRVLVHCAAGVSRSATICIAYLMKYHGLFFEGAYMAVKGARKIICPNTGFLRQLVEYERDLGK